MQGAIILHAVQDYTHTTPKLACVRETQTAVHQAKPQVAGCMLSTACIVLVYIMTNFICSPHVTKDE